jgi:hypothetical protein
MKAKEIGIHICRQRIAIMMIPFQAPHVRIKGLFLLMSVLLCVAVRRQVEFSLLYIPTNVCVGIIIFLDFIYFLSLSLPLVSIYLFACLFYIAVMLIEMVNIVKKTA